MIQQHADLYYKLTQSETQALWTALHQQQLIQNPPPKRFKEVDQMIFAKEICSQLSHAEIVLSIANKSDDFYLNLMEKLIKKPIYLCARGETGVPTTDINGNPLPYPVGHRRGEPTGTAANRFSTKPEKSFIKRDPRIIRNVVPNPKQPGTKTYERFKLYTEGMTVEQYLILGGTRDDLNWDAKRGYITLDLPE
jgi:hypothetical protein